MSIMRPWGPAIHQKRNTQRAAISRGSLALLLVGAPMMFGACGGDGGMGGGAGHAGQATSGGAGHAGQATSGNANSAGQATSGGSSDGGSGNGGSAGLNGSGKAGAGSSCEISECLRANVCLDRCGGKVLYSGCCACAEGTVEELSCMTTGGQGSGGGSSGGTGSGGASSACANEQTCAPGQFCIGYRAVGGAVSLPDSTGKCVITKHVENGRCQNDFTYTCAEISDCDAPAATCHCGALAACGNTNVCRLPTDGAWLDKAVVLVCELQVP